MRETTVQGQTRRENRSFGRLFFDISVSWRRKPFRYPFIHLVVDVVGMSTEEKEERKEEKEEKEGRKEG